MHRLERQAKAGISAGTAEMVAGIEALMERVQNALRVELASLPSRAPSGDEHAAFDALAGADA